eukprot:scpid109570/ scgid1123/ 
MNKLQQIAECNLCPIQTNALNNSHLTSTRRLHNKSRHWTTTFHQSPANCPECLLQPIRHLLQHLSLHEKACQVLHLPLPLLQQLRYLFLVPLLHKTAGQVQLLPLLLPLLLLLQRELKLQQLQTQLFHPLI